jgi:predicted Zn-dependent peptidase
MDLGTILLTTALAWPQATATPAARPFEPFAEFRAGPGTRFSVLEVKDAPRETLFAFVPTGLLDDAAHQAQLAHLVEHMLIRSTDREGQSDGEITFNGETDDVALRLEVQAPPKRTGDALDKLLGWLQTTACDADLLEIEKQKIGLELDTTCKGGFTHKWALAAWNQVVRRGAKNAAVRGDVDHAAIRGDVMSATAEIVEAAIDDRVDLARVRIVAVGPVPVGELKALAQQQLAKRLGLGALGGALEGAAAKRHEAEAAKRAKGQVPLATGDLTATWDLPNSHLLAWYLLPVGRADDAAAALVLAQLLSVRLQADPILAQQKVVALASAAAVVPEGRLLMLSASGAADAATVLARFNAAIAEIFAPTPQLGTVENCLKMMTVEFAGLPDFKAQRRLFARAELADQFEAQVALNVASREQSAGHTFGELGAAFARITKSELETLVKNRLVPAKRSTLRLAPKG